jgi:ubiquinone/menaquinone biosynthesis C-methylase UbiE
MGFYRDAVFPRVVNRALDTATTREIRARVCAGLSGEVVELGFGSGLNLPHLPASVTRLHAVDPSAAGARLAGGRIRDARVPVVLAGLDAQRLPFEDASMDAALSTWTLCSVPDAVAALREVVRVLRPGGVLHFVEHGAAPDEGVRRWQDRWNPLQRRLACGCSLTRDIAALLEEADLRVVRVDRYYSPAEPRPWGATYEGVATRS